MKTVEDVCNWLHDNGFGRWSAIFRDNEIDSEILSGLDETDLEKLGLPLGPRRKLLSVLDDASRQTLANRPTGQAERRHLTVMFIDLVGSTTISSQLDPEEMREVIRAYQTAVADELARFEGHVAKYMGDGVLCYFGWPRTHEDEAERAVRAGLALVRTIAGLRTPHSAPLAGRVGIATGLVVVGDLVGRGSAQEEAVVGDTPNLAARLQGLATPGQVVIGGATRRLLGNLFELVELGRHNLKGIAEPAPAFAVIRERSLESRFAARAGTGMLPMIGRNHELALLLERWRQARAGEGQIVLLTGDAGIGKSRIIEALVEVVANEPHTRIRYQCSPFHTDSALHPAIQQLTQAAGLRGDEPLDAKLDRLEVLFGRTLEGDRKAMALMAMLLGLDGTSRYGELALAPLQRRNQTLSCLIGQLTSLARQKPVLWMIEDAHWIDPTTHELVELALDHATNARVLIHVTTRPTSANGLGGHPIVTRLTLNRLDHGATAAIINRIAYGNPLPVGLVDKIMARTDGVPLYIEEMTKAVLETAPPHDPSDNFAQDRSWSHLAVPNSLHDSLMARLDRARPVKEVAQFAAVIGRSFDHRTIVAMSTLPEFELNDALGRLVEAELIFRRGTPPDATYHFKHALVRDASCESLLKARRQILHLRLLDILEQRRDAAPEVMAQHAQAAGQPERAVAHWERAGAQAAARHAYKEANAHYTAAIHLC